ncbi:immunoglobulin-like domain-containing protein [Salimicrobium salexigens]|nr:immunoglobulin-like domain-containing protein [Salimicrobium salexigens]
MCWKRNSGTGEVLLIQGGAALNRAVIMICMVLLAGCQSGYPTSEYGQLPHTENEVTFKAESEVDNGENGVHFYIINASEAPVFYDMGYKIEKEVDGTWKELAFDEEVPFRERAKEVKPGESFESAVVLDEIESDFEPGVYRVVVTMTESRETEEVFRLASEFRVLPVT